MPRKTTDMHKLNPKLKGLHVVINLTSEQLQEYTKCFDDPIYFIKNYVKIVSVDKGVIPFNLYDYQEKLVKMFVKHRYVIAKMPRQVGKSIRKSTMLNIRNHYTGEEKNISVEEFFNSIKNEKEKIL